VADWSPPGPEEVAAYRAQVVEALVPARAAVVELGRVRDFLLAMDEPADLADGEVPELFLLTLGRNRRPGGPEGGGGAVKAGDDYRFFEPLRIGDEITVHFALLEALPKLGRQGLMYELHFERRFVRADGVLVARAIDKVLRWAK